MPPNNGLIARIPPTRGYRVTDHGLHTAMFLTRIHDRVLPNGLAILADADLPRPLRTAANAYQAAIDKLTASAGLAT